MILEKDRAIIAKSYYTKASSKFAKIKVYYGYEAITNLQDIQLPRVKRVEYVDTMYIEKEISKVKLEAKEHQKIISYYFEVAQKEDYWIFAQSYLPAKQKFTQLIALPIQNVLNLEDCNEI